MVNQDFLLKRALKQLQDYKTQRPQLDELDSLIEDITYHVVKTEIRHAKRFNHLEERTTLPCIVCGQLDGHRGLICPRTVPESMAYGAFGVDV